MSETKSKVCKKCKELKNSSDFYMHSIRKGTLQSACKNCHKDTIKEGLRRKKLGLPSLSKTRVREHGKRGDPDYKASMSLKNNYGITINDYNAISSKQDGKCAICGKHQSDMKRRLDVDHDHKTGRIRGLLCTNCNIGMGKFLDDEYLLLKAAEYLRLPSNDFLENAKAGLVL